MAADLPVWIMLGLGIGGIAAVIVWMGLLTRDTTQGPEIQKNLWIVFGVVGVLVGLFAASAYIYFTANTNYLTPFLLVLSFVNLFLSLFATSAATLQIAKS